MIFSGNPIYPLLMSLTATLIFWAMFSYVPKKEREAKLRPVVELDMLHVYQKLFSLFDLIMDHQARSSSFFQHSIRGGLLTAEDIKTGLQNKCLNNNYLYNPEANKFLMPIGRKIYDKSKQIDNIIDRIYNFSWCVSPDEILLLEQIRKELERYDYDDNIENKQPMIKIGNKTFYPAIPNIAYRAHNFYALYRLFLKFQNIVLNKNKFSNRYISLSKIEFYYYSGEYEKAKKEIKHYITTGHDVELCNNILALCEYNLGNKKECYQLIENIYKKRPHNGNLVAFRDTLKVLIDDENILKILNHYYSQEEIQILQQAINDEEKAKNLFIKTNKLLFMKQKTTTMHNNKNQQMQ